MAAQGMTDYRGITFDVDDRLLAQADGSVHTGGADMPLTRIRASLIN